MNPRVGLRLAQAELQAVQGLQRLGLLIHQDEQQLVGHLRQGPFGACTDAALARLACLGLVRWVQVRIGIGKRRNQPGEFLVRQSGYG